MPSARQLFDSLNQQYLAVHRAKEDLFWSTYMATSDDHDGFAKAEQAYKDFIADPANLSAVRSALAGSGAAEAADAALVHGLKGWLAVFEANIIDNRLAQDLMHGLIRMEAELFARRRNLVLQHIGESGAREEATLGMLSTNLGTNRNEAARRSSFDALMELERWVLAHGLLDIVRQRNAFARAQGFDNYFDYKVRKNEQMSSAELFAILDDFEVRTRAANQRSLADLRREHGPAATEPWNLRYFSSGDVTRQLDPYLPFAKALQRWVDSFKGLGIGYRGATLQLDLLERKGKFQNGFCHGPVPSHFDRHGNWVAGRINFTAEARPDQVGSGARAIQTLFHEGGHAAHFANVVQNSPCFSQEYAPTSMAFAETQSMFCDSLLGDADWLKRHARDGAGKAIPDELIRRRIEATQPFFANRERGLLVVPYFERALYQLDDGALQADVVLALAREWELRILGAQPAPRPLLSIPHLLNQESAASYHGYLLANMAVYQTRAYFERCFGFLADNVAIGPLLARHYWARGNGVDHNTTLLSLTGEPFNAGYLANSCNQTAQQAWALAQAKIADAATRQYPTPADSLDATICIVHGAELLAENSASDSAMCEAFEHWVARHYPGSQAPVAAAPA